MSLDLVLLHPPHVYDFRKEIILYGPVSDLVPASPVFEMYPFGFASMAEYLEKAGYRVRIINLAARMIQDNNFDVEKYIKRLKSAVYGIGFHWMVHAHGSVEIARLVKKYHPESKVLFGGFSSTYYYRQLLEYPEIDYVLRGDSTEEPLRQLVKATKESQSIDNIPNLAWKDKQENIVENEFSYVPDTISNVMIDHYNTIIRSVIRYLDLKSVLPVADWKRYPATAVFTCRGCNNNCVICGGSKYAFEKVFNRKKTVYRTPQDITRDIHNISNFSNSPICILGDIQQLGKEATSKLLDEMAELKFKNGLILEIFRPVSAEFLVKLHKVCPKYCLEISPESHDPLVRTASGKHYSNQSLEQMVSDALKIGCGRIDIFFMIGMPQQTAQSVMETVEYCDYLLDKFKGDRRLSLFIGPLAPFLDPGSLAFEQPEKYGYRIFYKNLEEHRQALTYPGWKYTLNYETEWLNRDQMMEVTYKAILGLLSSKARHGLISDNEFKRQEQRIIKAYDIEKRIEAVWNETHSREALLQFKQEVEQLNSMRASDRDQIELPTAKNKIKYLQALRHLIFK